MVITNTSIDVKKIISTSDTTVYTANTVHLEVTNSIGTTLVHTPTYLAVSGSTPGLITFVGVPLQVGGNSIKMFLSDGSDLDVGVTLTKLGSSYVRVITNTATEITL